MHINHHYQETGFGMKLFTRGFLIFCTLLFLSGRTAFAEEATPAALVLGKPVIPEEKRPDDTEDRRYILQELILEPLYSAYAKEHHEELVPTSGEISSFLLYCKKQHEQEIAPEKEAILNRMQEITDILEKQADTESEENTDLHAELFFLKAELEPPGYDYAMFILPFWKLQKHLYMNFGEGRIIPGSRGYEAFDAIPIWLKTLEGEKKLIFNDKALRSLFFSLWAEETHKTRLIENREIIDNMFLNPEWLQ